MIKMNHSEEFVLGLKPKVIHCFLFRSLTDLLKKKLGRSHCLPRLVTVDPLGYQMGWEIILIPLGVCDTSSRCKVHLWEATEMTSSTRNSRTTQKSVFTYYLADSHTDCVFVVGGWESGSGGAQDSHASHLCPSSWSLHEALLPLPNHLGKFLPLRFWDATVKI